MLSKSLREALVLLKAICIPLYIRISGLPLAFVLLALSKKLSFSLASDIHKQMMFMIQC